jgi:hypothetical protein
MHNPPAVSTEEDRQRPACEPTTHFHTILCSVLPQYREPGLSHNLLSSTYDLLHLVATTVLPTRRVLSTTQACHEASGHPVLRNYTKLSARCFNRLLELTHSPGCPNLLSSSYRNTWYSRPRNIVIL